MDRPILPLGPLRSTYGIAPEILQRAAFIAVLSFVFFLGTMVLFYWRNGTLYFLLATAFLALYIATMLSFVLQKRNVVKVYEGGLVYRNFRARWPDIESVELADTIRIRARSGKRAVIPQTVAGFDHLAIELRDKCGSAASDI